MYKFSKKTFDYLTNKGFNFSYQGFHYLGYMMETCDSAYNFTVVDMYKEIAGYFHTTYSAVERSIRYLFSKLNMKVSRKLLIELMIEYKGRKAYE